MSYFPLYEAHSVYIITMFYRAAQTLMSLQASYKTPHDNGGMSQRFRKLIPVSSISFVSDILS